MKPGADETSDVIGYLNYQCEQCGVSFMIRVYRRNYEGSEWQHGIQEERAMEGPGRIERHVLWIQSIERCGREVDQLEYLVKEVSSGKSMPPEHPKSDIKCLPVAQCPSLAEFLSQEGKPIFELVDRIEIAVQSLRGSLF